jgi:hypothetical protein
VEGKEEDIDLEQRSWRTFANWLSVLW